MEGPLPYLSDAPSIWAAATATPHKKSLPKSDALIIQNHLNRNIRLWY
jgi:hypothetical protein